MMKLVTPHVSLGGMQLAYVMPNLSPPITTTEQAIRYRAELQALAPEIDFMMTLFLAPALTPDEIRKAHKAGISGVKSYPRGVTTGSEGGVESYEKYYDVFEAMQECDMVLNLHGEVPSSEASGITVLNAEPAFHRHLEELHARFPNLRIVLEHATTKASVDIVNRLGPTVACTITAHHLALVVDDWAGNNLHFCKPVAKTYEDRRALREVIASGNRKFFLGSDSAPHPSLSKLPLLSQDAQVAPNACAAGVYTSPILLPLLAHLFETVEPRIPLERLPDFAGGFGRSFYARPASQSAHSVRLRRVNASSGVSTSGQGRVPVSYDGQSEALGQIRVIPYFASKTLNFAIASS
ncbi:uncharacterized protein L969DRAFT_87455 [Mixia osmundae IAM 14324]|nr:uncharacterized protein L969DRAFT_87455 [Mixia osmundae IAM 14324]KEI39493.1 hypothetical protein L969DRAFT_87455 [Mixia osmundae IAM 14324]